MIFIWKYLIRNALKQNRKEVLVLQEKNISIPKWPPGDLHLRIDIFPVLITHFCINLHSRMEMFAYNKGLKAFPPQITISKLRTWIWSNPLNHLWNHNTFLVRILLQSARVFTLQTEMTSVNTEWLLRSTSQEPVLEMNTW